METKKIFSNEPQKKGGKDSTRVILTAAGATTVAAGAAGYAAYRKDDEKPEEQLVEVEEPVDEQTVETGQHEQASHTQQTSNQTASASHDEIQPVASQAEGTSGNVQPTNETGTGEHATQEIQGETLNIDEVDPDLIAQEITAVEIDPNDVDMVDIIQIDAIDTLYTPDGSEMPVAAVHTPDGGQYLMVDVDNDSTFDVITDLEGNPIVQVDGNLTFSDVEDMMDETGGALAYNPDRDNQELANGGNPEDGILDTLMGIFDDDDDSEELVAENRASGDIEEDEPEDESEDLALSDEADDGDSIMEDDIS